MTNKRCRNIQPPYSASIQRVVMWCDVFRCSVWWFTSIQFLATVLHPSTWRRPTASGLRDGTEEKKREWKRKEWKRGALQCSAVQCSTGDQIEAKRREGKRRGRAVQVDEITYSDARQSSSSYNRGYGMVWYGVVTEHWTLVWGCTELIYMVTK